MTILITGGAGFIGCNLAAALLRSGERVTIVDNLSRPRTDQNLAWLQAQFADRLRFERADIRDQAAMNALIPGHDAVFHLASQVAVTTSVANPREDFEINAFGTLNVLEAARLASTPPAIFFASTNKVYGGMEEVRIVQQPTRYAYADFPEGISENQPLDFHSPYGCSKGAADQYVRDYARMFGIPTVVFRMSCIAGQRQFGNEDQGWVAHFLYTALQRSPVVIYGDGRQVRDVLCVEDLIHAFEAVRSQQEITRGQVYNVGGGQANTTSLVELLEQIEKLTGRKVDFVR